MKSLDFEASKKYGNLLALAYAYDSQKGFWIISRSMMLYEVAQRTDSTREGLLPLLSDGLYGKQTLTYCLAKPIPIRY